MIEHGHVHNLVPIATHTRPDGVQVFVSRCNDKLIENENHELVERIAGCELEEERVFNVDGTPRSVRYRFGSIWFPALNLLRLQPIPVRECDVCHGREWDIKSGVAPCSSCRGAGVVADDGTAIRPPGLNVV